VRSDLVDHLLELGKPLTALRRGMCLGRRVVAVARLAGIGPRGGQLVVCHR
jgi:hypothetical protein